MLNYFREVSVNNIEILECYHLHVGNAIYLIFFAEIPDISFLALRPPLSSRTSHHPEILSLLPPVLGDAHAIV